MKFTVWTPDGTKHTFEWGPKALFCIPINCKYQIFNGSGREPARLACTHDLPLTMNLFHNEAFILCDRNPKQRRYQPCRCNDPLCACREDPRAHRHIWYLAKPPTSPQSWHHLASRLKLARDESA